MPSRCEIRVSHEGRHVRTLTARRYTLQGSPMLSYTDLDQLHEEGERELCSQLRKETFEIEEAHLRRAERAARIAELQVPAVRRFFFFFCRAARPTSALGYGVVAGAPPARRPGGRPGGVRAGRVAPRFRPPATGRPAQVLVRGALPPPPRPPRRARRVRRGRAVARQAADADRDAHLRPGHGAFLPRPRSRRARVPRG